MVEFGRYSDRHDSGHSGVSMAMGFAPSMADLSLYVGLGNAGHAPFLMRLGKPRMGKGCRGLKHPADADEAVLRDLIAAGLADLALLWTVEPTQLDIFGAA